MTKNFMKSSYLKSLFNKDLTPGQYYYTMKMVGDLVSVSNKYRNVSNYSDLSYWTQESYDHEPKKIKGTELKIIKHMVYFPNLINPFITVYQLWIQSLTILCSLLCQVGRVTQIVRGRWNLQTIDKCLYFSVEDDTL